MDEIVNDEELIMDANPISLKERLAEDVEGDESTSNFYSEEEICSIARWGFEWITKRWTKKKARRQRKEWPCDWWVATKEVEWATIAFSEEPQTMEKALKGEDAKKWEITMQEEYDSLVVNNTWSLLPLPKSRKPISCKWVFKIKHEVDGEIEHYKARLVARGFTQTFGIDYNKTFALIAKFVSIHCIITLATIEDMEIHQMDIKTTFFNGDFEEEIYMDNSKDSHKNVSILCVSFTSHCMG